MEYMIAVEKRKRSGFLSVSGLINGWHCWSSVFLCVAVWRQELDGLH